MGSVSIKQSPRAEQLEGQLEARADDEDGGGAEDRGDDVNAARAAVRHLARRSWKGCARSEVARLAGRMTEIATATAANSASSSANPRQLAPMPVHTRSARDVLRLETKGTKYPRTSLGTSSLPMLQLCRAASGLSLGRASAAPRLLQPVLSAIPPSALHAAPAGAALKRPLCTNAASAGGSAAVPPESPAASASDEELPYAPRHGRRLLRTRIDAALRAARAGAELRWELTSAGLEADGVDPGLGGGTLLTLDALAEFQEMWEWRRLGKNGKDEPLTAEQELQAVGRRSTR